MSTSTTPAPITPTTNTNTTLLSDLCPFCNEAPPKYRCPACDARTCSLKCSKRHKAYKQCSGTRDPTEYIKRSKLTTPVALNRDFNFLTGVERAVLRGVGDGGEGDCGKVNKQAVQNREAFIEKSGVVVRSAPRGMKRARENRTDVVRTKKQRVLCWTIEWIICGEENRRILDDRVIESTKLFSAFFHPNNSESRKKPKPVIAKTRFYLKKVGTPANKPTLVPLNPAAELKDCLRGRTVEEYPTIYVTADEGHPEGFEVDDSIAANAGGKLEVLEESSTGVVEVDLDALEKVLVGNAGGGMAVDSGLKAEVLEERKGNEISGEAVTVEPLEEHTDGKAEGDTTENENEEEVPTGAENQEGNFGEGATMMVTGEGHFGETVREKDDMEPKQGLVEKTKYERPVVLEDKALRSGS